MKIITEKDKELSAIILEFLQDPILSKSLIEKSVGIPQGTFNRAQRTGVIPSQHIYPIICFLANYGFKLYGYSLWVDERGNLHGDKQGDVIRTMEVLHFKDGKTFERDTDEVTVLEEEMPDDYVASSFYKVIGTESVFWTNYSDL